jgi:hypothetical protein
MRKLKLIFAIGTFSAMSSCSPEKPEQINLILKVDPERPSALKDIMTETASKIGMELESQDFSYGGKGGTLGAFLASGSRASIMVRAISDEECHPREGRRSPTFSSSVYSVSIYRTSVFNPKMSLRDMAKVLRDNAKNMGASLVSESEKCTDAKH